MACPPLRDPPVTASTRTPPPTSATQTQHPSSSLVPLPRSPSSAWQIPHCASAGSWSRHPRVQPRGASGRVAQGGGHRGGCGGPHRTAPALAGSHAVRQRHARVRGQWYTHVLAVTILSHSCVRVLCAQRNLNASLRLSTRRRVRACRSHCGCLCRLVSLQTKPWCSKGDSTASHRLFHVSQLDEDTQRLLQESLPWPLRENPAR